MLILAKQNNDYLRIKIGKIIAIIWYNSDSLVFSHINTSIILVVNILKPIAHGFSSFLLWLEEHQIGILATIAAHLFIISIILILKINTYAERDYQIVIDFSHVDMQKEDEKEDEKQETPQSRESAQEFVQNMRQEYNVRTIPVNTASDQAVKNIEKMVQDIKTEMNITDPKPAQDQPAEIIQQEDKLLENEARIYDDKYPVDSEGQRTVYKGPTTISYDLSGRRHVSMPAPIYKCKEGGKIVVDIVVNARGYVLSADINRSKSASEDPCLVEAAKNAAERSRFNESSTAKQSGSITYIFIAQ